MKRKRNIGYIGNKAETRNTGKVWIENLTAEILWIQEISERRILSHTSGHKVCY
jgi:hypothetical protein